MKKEVDDTYYEQMLKRQQMLAKKIDTLQEKLKTFPDGNLVCVHDGNRSKWYRSSASQKQYIPKKDRSTAELLAAKKYLSLMLEDVMLEKQAVEAYLTQYKGNGSKAEKLLTENPDYQELLSPYFLPKSKKASEWMISPYQQNKKYPEQLCHKTISGNLVRSKSEALIDMCLCNHNIPFRYECALELGEATYFPDFTILHPKTEKLYYWEHFGRMDDPNYCKAAFSKMQTYALHGIVPSVNFITTYETRENPLNAETVENWIAHCFL